MSFFNYENKKVYYQISGKGDPLILLHGDAVSSKMFDLILPLYEASFTVIVIDFLGSGQSERLFNTPDNIYEYKAGQVISLVEMLAIPKVSLVGTSGGAWIAINAALQRPDLFHRIIADSFDGRNFANDFSQNLITERSFVKEDEFSKMFFEWCHGEDWIECVDWDTSVLLHLAESKRTLFCKPIDTLQCPVLLLGSDKDEMCIKNMKQEYEYLKTKIINAEIHMFEDGKHPSLCTNANLSFQLIKEFMSKKMEY